MCGHLSDSLGPTLHFGREPDSMDFLMALLVRSEANGGPLEDVDVLAIPVDGRAPLVIARSPTNRGYRVL